MTAQMKAIVYRGPKEMVIEELDKPVAGPQDVVIRTKYVSICGGDLHAYKNGYGVQPGYILGHEYIGYAEEVGDEVEGVEVGDRVWGMSANICGTCWYCEQGDYAHCSNILKNVTGQGVPGAMGQYLRLSPAILGQTIYKIPDSISDQHAALIEPFQVGAAEVYDAEVQPGDNVVVIGAGMIGNAIIQFCRIAGAGSITAVDVADGRLELAKQCGADHTINSAKEDFLETIQRIYGPNRWFHGESGRVDVAFETAGVGNTVNDAINAIKAGGKVVLVAPSTKDVNLDLAPVINKQPQFIIPVSGNYIQQSIDAMAEGKLVVEPLLSRIFPFMEAAQAFEQQANPSEGMKVLIEMDA